MRISVYLMKHHAMKIKGLHVCTLLPLIFLITLMTSSRALGESASYGLPEFLNTSGNTVFRSLTERGSNGNFAAVGRTWMGSNYQTVLGVYLKTNGNKDTSFNANGGADIHIGKQILDLQPGGDFLDNLCNAVVSDGTNFYAACRSMGDNGFYDVYIYKVDGNGDAVGAFGTSGLVDTNIGGDGTNGNAFVRGLLWDSGSSSLVIVGGVGFYDDNDVLTTTDVFHPYIAKFNGTTGAQIGTTTVVSGIDGTAVAGAYDTENDVYYMASTDTTGERNFYIHKFSTTLVEAASPWGDPIDFSIVNDDAGTDSVPAGLAVFTDVSGEEDLIVVVGANRADSATPPWNCAAVAVQSSDGNLYSGWGQVPGSDDDLGITIFNPDGGGNYDCILNAVAPPTTTSDFIITAGTAYSNANYDLLFAKLDEATGDLDTSFDTDGISVGAIGLADDVLNSIQLFGTDNTLAYATGRSTNLEFYGGLNVKVDVDDGTILIPPTIRSISPTEGPTAGGTTVTIRGSAFVAGMTVTIGGVSCGSVDVESAVRLTCVTGPHATGIVDAVATLPNTLSNTAVDVFEYVPPPTVSSVTPDFGTYTGGTSVTVAGTGFRPGMAVDFEGSSCVGSTTSPFTFVCTTTSHAAGLVDVTVTNYDTQTDTLTDGYNYIIPPTITSISPEYGPVSGGTAVTIVGEDFDLDGAVVTIGGFACTGVSVNSATEITCTTSDTGGTVEILANIEIVNDDGGYGDKLNAFTYREALSVTAILPDEGPEAGGQTVSISGTGFYDVDKDMAVTIGGVTCTSPTRVTSSHLTCVTGASTENGAEDVVITNDDDSEVTLVGGYTYRAPPTISEVSPDNGPAVGGGTITLTGTRFREGSQVTIDGVVCGEIDIVSDTSLTCEPGPHAGSAELTVVVTNPEGQSGQRLLAYKYVAAPVIWYRSPTGGTTAGGTDLVLTGRDFSLDATVQVGGVDCTILGPGDGKPQQSANRIDCRTGAHAEEVVDIVVTNTDAFAQTGTYSNGYFYVAPPTITNITPDSGLTTGYETISITGTKFVNGATVRIDGTACISSTYFSDTLMTCLTPVHAAGVESVTITNPDGQVAGPSNFTYVNPPAPTLTSIDPTSGYTTGGETITLTGTGFRNGSLIRVGVSNYCASQTYVSPTSMTCVAPATSAGTKAIYVYNPDPLPQSSGTQDFTVSLPPAPTISGLNVTSGSTAGGTAITITGTNFLIGATVTVEGPSCTSVVRLSSTTITCVTPAHFAGPRNVTVRNPDAQTATLTDGFTYVQASPTFSYITPTSGTSNGNTWVYIYGTNFASSGVTVAIGGSNCTSLSVGLYGGRIICRTTAHAPGTVNVVITNPDMNTATGVNAFTYTATPVVLSCDPDEGPTTGGTSITCTGENIVSGATANINGRTCTSPVVDEGDQTITCTTPSSTSEGLKYVQVRNPNAETGYAYVFTYIGDNYISSISPSSGSVDGGTYVTINGGFFDVGSTVTFDGLPCTSVSRISASQLRCYTPAHALGAVDVVVTSGSDTATSSNGYSYVNPPVITSVSPSSGAADGYQQVTITGTDFVTGAIAYFGGIYCNAPSVTNSTTMTCYPAPRSISSPTLVDVQVVNPGGQSDTLSSGYTFLPVPTLTSVSPSTGPASGGTSVTLTGTNFQAGASVQFGSASCSGVNVASATSITCTTPPHASGTVTVTVTNPDGEVATKTNAFFFASGGQWSSLSTSGAHSVWSDSTAVWTGSKMIVWGGVSAGNELNAGTAYDPVSDTWTPISTSGAPSPRYLHGSVWTGSRMVIWGGRNSSGERYFDGKLYDPATNTWDSNAMSITSGVPEGRSAPSVAMVGSQMIVWGGIAGQGPTAGLTDTGSVYNFSSKTWTPMTTTNAPSVRNRHSYAYVGSDKFMVWGGLNGSNGAPTNTGAVYDISANSWTTTSTGTNSPSARSYTSLVWTGTEAIVWGGLNDSAQTDYNNGAKYSVAGNSWSTMATPAIGTAFGHSAVWTGTKMIVWGGYHANGFRATGGEYTVAGNTWRSTNPSGAPSARARHHAVWTGSVMVIWGGLSSNGSSGVVFQDGRRYTPYY